MDNADIAIDFFRGLNNVQLAEFKTEIFNTWGNAVGHASTIVTNLDHQPPGNQ
jgi:hypothetical protein